MFSYEQAFDFKRKMVYFKCTIVMLSFVAFSSYAILQDKQGALVQG